MLRVIFIILHPKWIVKKKIGHMNNALEYEDMKSILTLSPFL